MKTRNISFRALMPDQLDLVIGWLHKPHVNEWYHGQGLQNTISGVKDFVNNNNPRFDAWIGYCDGKPFAFLMSFILTNKDMDDPDCHQAKWMEKGKKMIGIDLLIGEEDYLGKGLATPMIDAFLEQIHHEAKIIFIDPEASNTKAIHVYDKAGFEKLEKFIASWHPVPHILMRLKR